MKNLNNERLQRKEKTDYDILKEQINENFYVFKFYFDIKKNYSGREIPKDVAKMLGEFEEKCQINVEKICQILLERN